MGLPDHFHSCRPGRCGATRVSGSGEDILCRLADDCSLAAGFGCWFPGWLRPGGWEFRAPSFFLTWDLAALLLAATPRLETYSCLSSVLSALPCPDPDTAREALAA